jgi:3-oxoadipate enol-lactonase
METITHGGRKTVYEQAGTDRSGASVMYVHGSGGNSEIWRAQLERGTNPGVALDLSGHGDSGNIDAKPGYETLSAYADDVLAVAEETGSNILVGNSLGGAVCLHLVLERDFSPAALVLAGTGAKLRVMEDLLVWLDEDFEQVVEFVHGSGLLFHDADPASLERSKTTLYETGREVTRRDFRSCHTFDVRRRLDEIDVPTLALCGEYDGLTPPRYHEYLAENIQDSDLTVLPDAAHLAMLERPKAFNEALDEFLTRVEHEG